jgi:multiple sugar transport system permease protein
MISSSLKSASDFIDPTVVWVPKKFVFDNFAAAIKVLNIATTAWNTIRFELVSAFIEVCSCAVVAYGLSRFDFPEKKFLNVILILTILVPAQMTIIPMVINFKQMDFLGILHLIGNIIGKELRPNLLDTPLTFYLPSLFSVGLKAGIMIYIYSQFFKGLPKELEEASWIDGAGPLKTFLRVIVPASGVAILTVSMFSIIWHWNDYYLAVMYTSKNHPISAALANIYSTLNVVMGYNRYDHAATSIAMAACLITILPMLIMYLVLQRRFIQSIDRVGIVG